MHAGHLVIKQHIFLTGATGYIGGSVLTRLISHPLSETFRLTVMVRAPEKATQFRKMGIQAVVGSNSDLDLLTKFAAEADIVIACTDADNLEAVKATLRGLKQRNEKTGKVPSLIQTSGTGVLIDDARGQYASDKIYSDLDISTLAGLPRTQPHREVDLTVIDADKEGYVKTYIILPTTIFGRATGPLVDAGLQNPRSQQIPQLVDAALARGRAGILGKGANIWSNVHINDLASLYALLIDFILPHQALVPHLESEGPSHPISPVPKHIKSESPEAISIRPRTPITADHSFFTHGEEGYYFAENGEHTWASVSEAIGAAMVDVGKAADPTPTQFTEDEKKRFFNNVTKFLDSNSRCKANRARKLGWRPKKTTKDLIGSIKQEVRGA